MNPEVLSRFHVPTKTWSHVLVGADGRTAAIIDPVLDYEARSGRTSTASARALLDLVAARGFDIAWILETHAHADHLTAAAWLRGELRGRAGARVVPKVGIGSGITRVQANFRRVFNLGDGFPVDGRQFDHLFADGETFDLGGLPVRVLATPGHTDDSVTYVAGKAAFVGDTIFAPDTGSARCDFPGGDARSLYRSIHRIYALGDDTRMYLCHDYPEGREAAAFFTVADQKARNKHLAAGTSEDAFVAMRSARDATLSLPELLIPSVQVNIRAGHLPEPEANGVAYLKVPLDLLGADRA